MGSSLIGQLRILLGLETAQLETGARRARKELSATRDTAELLKRTLDTVGIALGATAFYDYAKSALEYASALDTTAKRIGVTVEQLQVMRKAARENGVASDVMEQGLARLNLRLGQAKAGLPAAVKAFKDIGISRAQLQSFHEAGDVLPFVEEGLNKAGDSATKSAAAYQLLTRAAMSALPVFAMGKQAYDEMYDSAVKAGLITADEASKAHEAQDAVEDLAIALKTKLAIALADNAGEIVDVVKELENLINMVGSAISALNSLPSPAHVAAQVGLGARAFVRRAEVGAGLLPAGLAQAQEQADIEATRRVIAADDAANAKRNAPIRFTPHPPPPNTLDQSEHHKPKHHADHAEQRAKEAERLQFELDKELLDGKKALVEAQGNLTNDFESRADFAKQAADLDLQEKQLSIRHDLQMVLLDKTISDHQKEEARLRAERALKLADDLHVIDLQKITNDRELQRQKDAEALVDAQFDAKRQLLDDEEKLATTAAERRKIELELLDLAYQQKKLTLDHIRNDLLPNGEFSHTPAERAQALVELNGLDNHYALQRQGVLQGTAGPLEQLLRGIPDTADKMNEALEGVAAQGIQDLNDGLTQAAVKFLHLGGVAGNVLQDIFAGVMKILLARYVDAPIAGFLGKILGVGASLAGAAGGGGGLGDLGAGTGTAAPGFATGGSMLLGGMAGIDTNRLSLNGTPIAQVTRGETLSITPANDRGGGGGDSVTINQSNNFAGGAATMEDVVRVAAATKQAALRAFQETKRRS